MRGISQGGLPKKPGLIRLHYHSEQLNCHYHYVKLGQETCSFVGQSHQHYRRQLVGHQRLTAHFHDQYQALVAGGRATGYATGRTFAMSF